MPNTAATTHTTYTRPIQNRKKQKSAQRPRFQAAEVCVQEAALYISIYCELPPVFWPENSTDAVGQEIGKSDFQHLMERTFTPWQIKRLVGVSVSSTSPELVCCRPVAHRLHAAGRWGSLWVWEHRELIKSLISVVPRYTLVNSPSSEGLLQHLHLKTTAGFYMLSDKVAALHWKWEKLAEM